MDEELGGLTQDDFVIPPVKYECKLLFINLKRTVESNCKHYLFQRYSDIYSLLKCCYRFGPHSGCAVSIYKLQTRQYDYII